MSGDCFEVAANMVLRDPTLTLVHGTAVGQGPIEGVHHAHAWCERTDVIQLPDYGEVEVITAIDRSNGKTLEMPAALFYNIGRIYGIHRYDHDAMCRQMITHEHYGPWHE